MIVVALTCFLSSLAPELEVAVVVVAVAVAAGIASAAAWTGYIHNLHLC